jgi:excisionase family DNA binding protein
MNDDVLTIRDVAEYLKVNETVYNLARKAQITGFKVGGQWRFRRADINRWVATQTADTLAETHSPASSAPRAEATSGRKGRRKR